MTKPHSARNGRRPLTMNDKHSSLAGATVPSSTPQSKHARKPSELIGETFGQLIVIGYAPPDVYSYRTMAKWLCRCTCGREVSVRESNLKSGNSTSCGCFQKSETSRLKTTHGQHKGGKDTPQIQIYWHAHDRCYNENSSDYPRYGGRTPGPTIKFDPRWLGPDGPSNFVADMATWIPAWAPGLTLERKDNNKNYGPTNCRWASRKEQARNTRRNHKLTIDGVTHCIVEWSEISGVLAENITNRINNCGWSAKAAVFTPVG